MAEGLEPCGGSQRLSAVLAVRRQLLVAGLRRLQPDLFLVDSFPFSRWALRVEILAGIRLIRKPLWRTASSRRYPPGTPVGQADLRACTTGFSRMASSRRDRSVADQSMQPSVTDTP